ncbi:MAG: Hpt domain-containing protein, partial [Oscillospiraceae bacterium]|nr:Hpt domain-containing protein [Oscillospiraceae bacterium]
REPVTAPSAPGLFEDAAIDSIQIPGIDFAKGMALYGDDMELYGTIIESYARNTPEVISKLRNVTEETLAEYAINVHGLKGSSGNIGAESLRELAARMEKAAKAGNLDEVLEQNDSMLLKAEELISNIEKWTQMPGSGGSKPVRATIDNALLDRLCGCCENFDMNGADDAMSQLLEFSYEQNNGLIEWLSEKVATSEFDEIVERIKEYRGESK